MKRLILLRHGECRGKGTYLGRGSQVSLTDAGREQISGVGRALREQGFTANRLIRSSLRRAEETGRILAKELNFPENEITGDSRLDENHFGLFEGMSYKEISLKYPRESQRWFDDPWNNSPPKGESASEIAARVESFYRELKKEFPREEGNTLIVGHGGSLRFLICYILNVSPRRHWHFRLERGGMAVFRFAGDFPVLTELSRP
ncbi:MAG: histidine phosphatase family protein [Spirochaetales bacterium]|nr:histidine phosphatase family protein [Spirochaetales bacterium]